MDIETYAETLTLMCDDLTPQAVRTLLQAQVSMMMLELCTQGTADTLLGKVKLVGDDLVIIEPNPDIKSMIKKGANNMDVLHEMVMR